MEKTWKGPRKRKKRKPYTKGQLNRLVDDLCHPFFKENPGFVLVDGLLHGMVENDLPLTVKKFMKYDFPKLLKEVNKKAKVGRN